MVAFIRSLQAGPVHVVAWSYGGSVATLAASQQPELFRSLSLHEPTIGRLIVNTPEGKAAPSAPSVALWRRYGRSRMPERRPWPHSGSGSSC